MQRCIEERERLIPLEQAARQKVTELASIIDSEKSQGSVLKAILQAKESNTIPGICGRMGDLGAIDGKLLGLGYVFSYSCIFIILWYEQAIFYKSKNPT